MRLSNHDAITVQVGLVVKAFSVLLPKRRDYSGDQDPYANFRRSELFNVPPWVGALIRLTDKLSRLYHLVMRGGQGEVSDESLIDTAADALNYLGIAFGLMLEALPEHAAASILQQLADAAATVTVVRQGEGRTPDAP